MHDVPCSRSGSIKQTPDDLAGCEYSSAQVTSHGGWGLEGLVPYKRTCSSILSGRLTHKFHTGSALLGSFVFLEAKGDVCSQDGHSGNPIKLPSWEGALRLDGLVSDGPRLHPDGLVLPHHHISHGRGERCVAKAGDQRCKCNLTSTSVASFGGCAGPKAAN